MIENVGAELKKYFEGKSIFSPLLGLASYILYVAAALILLGDIISLGSFADSLVVYVFYLAIVLCLANLDFKSLMIGFAAASLGQLILLLRCAFAEYGGFLSWSTLLTLVIYGFFTYASYMKTMKKAA